MRQTENRFYGRSFPFFGHDLKASSCPFGRLLEKRNPKPYLPGSPCCKKRICDLLCLFHTHPASIISDLYLQRVLCGIRRHVNLYVTGLRAYRILCYVQNIQCDLRHHTYSYLARISSISSTVSRPYTSSLIIITGARPQAPTQRQASRENLPSGVHSPPTIPSFSISLL